MGKINEDFEKLTSILWRGADVLRSKMDANTYKDYILPLTFFKFLSDKNLRYVHSQLSYEPCASLEEMQKEYENAKVDVETWHDLKSEMLADNKYYIEPENTYTNILSLIEARTFQRENLDSAFKQIESCSEMYADLFSSINIYSTALGINEEMQSKTLVELLQVLGEINMLEYDGDAIGDSYEYMLGEFASETGKKAGEFYTPKRVSEILTRIAIEGQKDKKGLLVYDPAMGSGSLLLAARHYSEHRDYVNHFGQEIMATTFNLARMNMILHGVSPERQHLHNGDTLDKDWPTDLETEFDMVVMNPPYSINWSASEGFKTDSRFSGYGGVLPPKSKADYAFLLHGLYHLKASGTMAIVLPHGVLFRGAAEGQIRKILCQKGNIYAVIGLPEKLFYNTGIPTTIVVLKKTRENLDRSILFIDASKDFEKGKNRNNITEKHIDAILEMYKNRIDVEKKCHLASYEEIEKNDFNLNIPRYVDSSEEEEKIDIAEVVAEIEKIDTEIKAESARLYEDVIQLTSEDDELVAGISKLAELIKGWC